MRNCLLRVFLLLATLSGWVAPLVAEEFTPRLKLAFVSNREHYWYPHVYIYEHDGQAQGRIVTSIQPMDKRLDHQPVLSADGRWCVYGSEMEGGVGQIHGWDLVDNKASDLGSVNSGNNAVFSPSLSSDATLLAFSAWGRAGVSGRWDVLLLHIPNNELVPLPGLNSPQFDERRAAISGNGRWLAYTTNAEDAVGLTDIRLYDRTTSRSLLLSRMNSIATDSYPCLNADGRLLCFASDRAGGAGGLDVYLYDREQERLLELPGLNSPGHEQSPSITADGRYIAFVSERFDGVGEHDIFVYDRQSAQLLELPDLNTDRDDYDPCLIELGE